MNAKFMKQKQSLLLSRMNMCNLAKREDFFIEKVRQKMRKYEKQTKNSKHDEKIEKMNET